MKSTVINNELTLYPEGVVNSNNADAVGAEIDAILNRESYQTVTVDAKDLQYLSSAGLRIMLKIRKRDPSLKIINVNSELYDIFEMTGFTEMINISKAYRICTVDGCDVIGKGAKGTVYRYDAETIIKVYNNPDSLPDIQRERELARRAFVLGIPTAISYEIVRVGNSYGSVFELLDAKSYSQMIKSNPDQADKYITDYAQLLIKIHNTTVSENDMPDFKTTVNSWLATDKDWLPQDVWQKLNDMVQSLPNRMTMLHCDYHTNNVMLQNGETLLIDMDTLSHGHPIFELANVYTTYVGFGEMNPTIVEKFLDLDYATAKHIWNKFLQVYLDTTDQQRLTDVENKSRLLSYARMLRHTVRRGQHQTPEGKLAVNHYINKIIELSKVVDTLEF